MSPKWGGEKSISYKFLMKKKNVSRREPTTSSLGHLDSDAVARVALISNIPTALLLSKVLIPR